MTTASRTAAGFSPSSLSAKSNVWSIDAISAASNQSTIPSDAFVISATIEAQQTSVKNGSGTKLRAKLGNNNYQEVDWKTGPIALTQFVGLRSISNVPWYVGFKATEIAVLVGGKLTYLGTISMNAFQMVVTYGYDRFTGIMYDSYLAK